MDDSQDAALTYVSYLALDDLLGAQRPRSDEHDEMLFIVVHQVYELWFKQILHELARVQQTLTNGESAHALHSLRRVLTILKVVVAQIDVLETMTPRQFLGFRARLESASGFQSAQFRQIEAVLPTLFDSLLAYLATQGYVVDGDVQRVLVAVYGDDGDASQVCERLVDLDEGFQEWRYRHVKMVQRTIGDAHGTGGSGGAAYLRTTLFQAVFPELWAVRNQL
jgi:tryptophan 2,3-dioxygenase